MIYNKIAIKRGLKANLPASLREGELAYCTDTSELYIGTTVGNVLLNYVVGGGEDPIDTTLDNLEADLNLALAKNYSQDKELADLKETILRASAGEEVGSVTGAEIIHLGKDVANAGLKVKQEGKLELVEGTLLHENMNKRYRAVGKNLLDIRNDKILKIDPNTTLTFEEGENCWKIQNKSTIQKILDFDFKTNTRYTFTFRMKQVTGNPRLLIRYTDNTISYVGTAVLPTTLTTYTTTSVDNKTIKQIEFEWGSSTNTLFISIDLNQLEQGTTATTYEPYVSTDMFVNGGVGYSLPNGVKDSVEFRNGKAYKVERVKKYTLQASDISSLITTLTNVDLVRTVVFSDNKDWSDNVLGDTLIPDRFEVAGANRDNLSSVGGYYTNTAQWIDIIVAKGTYATLAEAQADLVGTDIYYQLATPIETELQPIGNLQGHPNGTVYVDNIVPETLSYDSGLATEYGVDRIERIVKLNNDGSQTEFAINTVTITDNEITSITGASYGDLFYVEYYYTGVFVAGPTTIEYYDNKYVVVDQTTGTVYKWNVVADNGVFSIEGEAI